MTPTVGSLFSGIGGMDLGLERAGFQVRWQVENDAYASRVLAKHWPDVQRYGDIRTVDWNTVERVDLVAGGFPCQPVSVAGKRRAQADERWMWPEFARCVRALRPRFVLVENVPNLLVLGFGDVLGELATLGFDAEWQCLPAAAFGAPHRRDRLFLVAYAASAGSQGGSAAREVWGRKQPPRSDWWRTEPDVARVAARVSPRVHRRIERTRGLGNAVVPQIAEWLGHRLHALM